MVGPLARTLVPILLLTAILTVSAVTRPSTDASSSTATIEFRFARDGRPVFLALAGGAIVVTSADEVCPIPADDDLHNVLQFQWPPAGQCQDTPAVLTVQFQALNRDGSEFVLFDRIIDWDGSDLTQQIEVPQDAMVYPSPLPTPHPPSTVTVRFVHGGLPVNVGFGQPPHQPSADGVNCPSAVPTVPVMLSSDFARWPYPQQWGTPYECVKGPPTTLLFRYGLGSGNYFTKEVVWEGEDKTVDVEVPAEAIAGYPESTTIGMRFVSDGSPVSIGVFGLSSVVAGGTQCHVGGPDGFPSEPFQTASGELLWPRFADGTDYNCFRGPPMSIELEVLTELGPLSATIEWTGGDILVPVEVDLGSLPSQFPNTGAARQDNNGLPANGRAIVVALGTFLMLAGGLATVGVLRCGQIQTKA